MNPDKLDMQHVRLYSFTASLTPKQQHAFFELLGEEDTAKVVKIVIETSVQLSKIEQQARDMAAASFDDCKEYDDFSVMANEVDVTELLSKFTLKGK
jgi:hypothetical protein